MTLDLYVSLSANRVPKVHSLHRRARVLSRREFFHTMACAMLALPAGRWRHASVPSREQTLRLLAVIEPRRVQLRDGFRFGIAEGARSAALFGWKVEALDEGGEVDLDAQPHAIVLAAPGRLPTAFVRLPVLRLVCENAPDDGSFLLAPCDAQKAAWLPSLSRYGAEQLNDRYRSVTGTPMTSDAWLGWFAVKLLVESALRTRSTEPDTLRAHLADPDARFDGHKGEPLRFDAARRLVQPLYQKE